MKKSKRIVAMLVCVLFTVTLFAGCGSKATDSDADKTGKTDTGAETKGTNDPITITCMFSDHPSQPYQEETWVLPKVIKEKFNITMEMQAIPSSAFEEKRNATLASGDIPDIIVGMEKIVADDYGRKGMFINFMNYKNIMPNMLATLEKYEPLKVP
jgi:putative aldouronate transport system substrate-binding protein